jgi:hypothetical protein
MTAEEYWNQNNTRKDQKFYTAFCLLQTAISDYAVARELNQEDKLNWAATAYYYSLVHSLRLVTFIALGDFPTGHAQLAELYKNGSVNIRRTNHAWLPNFSRTYRDSLTETTIEFRRKAIAAYFTKNRKDSSAFERRLGNRGLVLDKARECRNDSNYEGLIIAHEHAHRLVTGSLEKLSETLRKTCEAILPEIVVVFKKFLEQSERKDHWYAYINWKQQGQGISYFEDSLNKRVQGKKIVSQSLKWVKPIRRNNTESEKAREVFENIKLGTFLAKESLMEDFGHNIGELKEFFEKRLLMEKFERRIADLESLSGEMQ